MNHIPLLVGLTTSALFCNALLARAAARQTVAALQTCEIVIPAKALANTRYAALEFQRGFAMVARVTLPIVTVPTRPLPQQVYIGDSAPLRTHLPGVTADDLAAEEHRIVIRQGQLAIVGGGTRGTLYGVYTFLEDFLGIRFLTVGHTHAPNRQTASRYRSTLPTTFYVSVPGVSN